MWVGRLIRRDVNASTRIQPDLTQTEWQRPGDTRLAHPPNDEQSRACEADPEYSLDDNPRGSHAVFGLIGTTLSSEDRVSRWERGDESNGAADLIEALHAQYCRALSDPHASLAGSWEAQPAFSEGVHPASHHDAPAAVQAPHIGSIEALLSGARFMEDVFGPLAADPDADFAASEPVPEVLGLFAPQDYLAAAARRACVLPPTLARREHHALGIDSPLPASPSATHEQAR